MNIEYSMTSAKFTILYDDDQWVSIEFLSEHPIKQTMNSNGDLSMCLRDDIMLLIGEREECVFVRINVQDSASKELAIRIESARSHIEYIAERNIIAVDNMIVNLGHINVQKTGSNIFNLLLKDIDNEITIQNNTFDILSGTNFKTMDVISVVNVGEKLPELSIEFDDNIQTYKDLPCIPFGDLRITVKSDNINLDNAKLKIRRTGKKGILGVPESINITDGGVSYNVLKSDDVNTFEGMMEIDVSAHVIIHDVLHCKATVDIVNDGDDCITYDDPKLY